MMDVRLIDHVIVTADGYYSFADEGIFGLEGFDKGERNFVSAIENLSSEEQLLMRQNNVIVDVIETNLNSFVLTVEHVNFMIYHKECVVYSILITEFKLTL